MKRKTYTTDHERKIDQLRGFIAFPLVNGALGLVVLIAGQGRTGEGSFLNLVWPINILILIMAFLFRPQMGVGCVMAISVTIVAVMLLGTVFLASCVAGYAVAVIVRNLVKGCRIGTNPEGRSLEDALGVDTAPS